MPIAAHDKHHSDETRILATPEIALIGGIHMDRVAHGKVAILPDTSTPGAIEARPGGVASNVARILARLSITTALAGRLGEDADGDKLRAELMAVGIDTSAIKTSDLPTASYLALHHPDGSLAAAVVDTAITEEITAEDFSPLPPSLAGARWWFLDTNLREDTLQGLCALADDRLIAADAVSLAKAPRLAPCLTHIEVLFANRAEATALLNSLPNAWEQSDRSAEDLAEALCAAGVANAVVTDGGNGLAYCQASAKNAKRLNAHKAHIRDVTGAGDALIGGTLSGLIDDLPLEDALGRGLAAAALTLEQTGAAGEALDMATLAARLGPHI